jgi:hypothetical protein
MTTVYLEVAPKRTFACSYEWPGLCRSGRTEEEAIETLDAYRDRYREVADLAGVRFPARSPLEVVDRIPGSATTEFGAPGEIPDADWGVRPAARARRDAALVQASWVLLEQVVATAPATLRKGPRGGGRDRDQIDDHVTNAEQAYAHKLGVRTKGEELRSDLLAVIGRPSPASEPKAKPKVWPAAYCARRVAWHVLDHAWEIQDKSD